MPNITASIGFLANLPLYEHEKPFRVILSVDTPDVEESEKSNIETEIHEGIEVKDIRNMETPPSLNTFGFEVLNHSTKYPRLDQLAQCKGYTKETTELLEKHFGALCVITWDLNKRNVIQYEKGKTFDANDPRQTEGPAVMAHVDYSFDGGLRMIDAYLNAEDKAKYLNDKYRIRIVNTWRPMVPTIENSPLALCDGRSLLPNKLVACDRVLCGRLGENYLVQFHEGQKWYWLDRQTSSEPYLFLDWDSEAGGGARFCAHAAFQNPTAAANVPPRQSVETRSIVITLKDEN